MSICLVAIGRNEGRFVKEWIAHYLALGFDQIIIYDHNSTDGMGDVVKAIGQHYPVEYIPWDPDPEKSPQMAAYAHALATRKEEWIAFFDMDEMLVLNERFETIHDFLRTIPDDAGAIAINWLVFGSNGQTGQDYGLVRDAFRTGGPRTWGNNHHIKTIARTDSIESMGIHDCVLHKGRYVLANGETLSMSRKRGISDVVDHSVAQLNHYQVKSSADFWEKMKRGRAGKKMTDPSRIRENPEDFFRRLDRNEFEYDDIDRYGAKFEKVYKSLPMT